MADVKADSTDGTGSMVTDPDRIEQLGSTEGEHPAVPTPITRRPWQDRLPGVTRIGSHLVVWSCLLVPVIIELARGWVPVGDNAAIAIRAHQALSLHPPVVGMFTSAGRDLYDPGPLLFWLLAVPTHLDPVRGPLWGAAVVCGAVLSVAIEAVWRTRLWLGCAVIAFVMVDLLWLTPEVLLSPMWNAYFPIPFLIACLALAWVVARGGWGWWPPLVFVASVAAQSHLLFTIPSVALAVLAPLVGMALAGSPRRWRWVLVGGGVGLVCWLAPILQNFGPDGNLSALLASGRGQPVFGSSFGLKTLATATNPSPIWLTHEPTGWYSGGQLIGGNSSSLGIVALVILAAIAAGAWRVGRRSLAALAAVTVIALAGIGTGFAIFPVRSFVSLNYLTVCLWVLGILFWTVVVWTVLVLGAFVVRLRTGEARLEGGHPDEAELSARSTGWLFAGAMFMVVMFGLAAFSALPSVRFPLIPTGWEWQPADTALVANAAKAVERVVPRQTNVTLTSPVDADDELIVLLDTEALAYRLESDGWQPSLTSLGADYTLLRPGRDSVTLKIVIDGTHVVSVTRVR